MISENLVILGGVVERDPEYYEGTEGKDTIGRCTFPLIVSSFVGEKKYTMKVNMIAWGELSHYIMKTISRNSHMVVRGSLNIRGKVQDSGAMKWITEVVIEKIIAS